MTDKQLEFFIAAAKHGSFLQASRLLYVSPQAIAQKIDSLASCSLPAADEDSA